MVQKMKTAYEQGRLVLLQNLDPSLSSSEVRKMHSSGKHNGATTARLQNGLHFRDAVGRKRMGDCLNELGMEDLKLLEEEMDKAAKVVHERKILDDDGIAAPGEILRPYDIYINKQSPIDTHTPKIGPANLPDSAYRSNAQSFNDNGGEVVDRVVLCSDKDNNMCIKFLIRHTRMHEVKVIERRLRKETQVTENQFGFMPGRSTMEAIYLLRRVMEQYRMAQQDLHLIFIDLEKAYDRVPREILWKALEKKGVRVAYIRAIQDMYDRVSTSVRTQGGESDDFPITIGLHQGSTLSPYLFTLILDVLTEQIQEIVPRCMLFADDIVLLGESREELNERLETWRRALETHGFRLSRSKSEYMECKFNKRRRVSNSEDDGEIEGDVNHRIQAGWMKWRKASGVLCDAKVPIKLKGKFYRTAVRPAILYGTECWAVKSQHENKVGVAEMRMLRWMCGKIRQDKIRNEAIRERVGVAPIVEKMVENRLRWFGHVERRPVDSVVRRVDQMERRQTIRGRGRPKKTIREVIKKDLEINGLDRSMLMFFGVFYRIWNHEKAILLNSFDNHDFPDEGIPKLCLVNELDDSLLLDASSDGNIQIWKDYTLKGKQKLVTAFSLIHGHKPGMRSLNAVVDWQQQCGYLCLSVGKPHLCMMWFVLNDDDTTAGSYGEPM
ncbi:Regulatory-associated protein of TOR 1 [Glycine soja]